MLHTQIKQYIASFLVIFFFNNIVASTLIITHSYNRPDFIEIQHKTFKKFVLDDYEYVVFNDAPDDHMANQIAHTCNQLGIKCIRIPQDIHNRPYLKRQPSDPLHRPNIRHANCIQYSLDTVGFEHNGVVLIVDSDNILIRPINISEYMQNKDIASPLRESANSSNHTIPYMNPILCFLAMHRLPDKRSLNFNCGLANGAIVDTGGWTYYYINNHPEVRVVSISSLWSYRLFCPHNIDVYPIDYSLSVEARKEIYRKYGFNEKEMNFFLKRPDTFEVYLDNHFLHYRAGSNYNNLSHEYHNNKMALFNEFINDILQD